MLFSDKSFSVFEINGLRLPPKIFTIRTQKIKPVDEWKVTCVNCPQKAGILGYLEDRCFRIILKRTGCFSLTYLLGFFEINEFPLLPKNFTILTQKIKPVEEWKDTGVYCQYYRLGF